MSKWMQAKLETLSHIDSDYFFGALDRMGYSADFTTKQVTRSYEGDSRDVDCVLVEKATGNPVNVGLKFSTNEDNTVNMVIVADFFYTRMNSKSFTEKFTIEYNTVKYESVAAEMNFSVESEETLQDGRRKIVLTRAA